MLAGGAPMAKGCVGPSAWLLAPLGVALALLAAAPEAAASDTTAPSITDLRPEEGAFVNASALGPGGLARPFIHATIADDSVPESLNVTAQVLWVADLSTAALLTAELSPSRPGALEVGAFAALKDGEYRLVVEAVDSAGNPARAEHNFTVDTKAPRLTASAPAVSPDAAATLLVDARDEGSGLALPLTVSYRSACASTWSPVTLEVTPLPGRAVGQASLALCEGTNNQFSVTARDRAGNTAQVLQRKIAYDTHAPGFTSFSPGPFERVDDTHPTLEVWVTDNAVGVNRSSVEAQVSTDGGTTWGPWRPATVGSNGSYVRASLRANFTAGATGAVRWRASDLAGNGPSESSSQYFYLNGPPFVVHFEPAEGAQIFENSTVRLVAEFADPDADFVEATVYSDIDGPLGRADGRRVQLSPGVHTLTLQGDDGHGHVVTYAYQVEVVSRLPPDLRPLILTLVIAGSMVWAAFAAWTRDGEGEGSLPAKS